MPFRLAVFGIVLSVMLPGCLGVLDPSDGAPGSPPWDRFAFIHATANLTVTGPSIDRPTSCGRPVYTYSHVDVANRTLQVVATNQSLKRVAPAHLLFEDFEFVDSADSCPRLRWLLPLLKNDTRLIIDLHGHGFPLNMTRDEATVRWEGLVVNDGDFVERNVSFQRELGGRHYTYEGTIRLTFRGLWELAHVSEVADESGLAEPGARAFWHHPRLDGSLHVEA